MKAAVLERLDQLVVKEIPTPAAEDGGILVKVESCAVCGSDIRILHHGNARVSPPNIMGHELAGEVVEVGRGTVRFQKGDRVAVGADVPCGECAFCEAGIGNNCQTNFAIGYQLQGGFAQFIPLNAMTVNFGPVHKIPDPISYNEAALAEPLGCVLNALELSGIRLGDVVCIIGAGPIGIMIIQVAKRLGASKVIVVQRSRPRLVMAMQLGADVGVCSQEEDPVAAVLAHTGGLGADVVITANPSPDTHAIALHMAKNRARVNLFGGLPKGSMVSMDTNIIHYKELFVHGAHGALPRHHRQALELIGSGTIDMKRYISHEYPLDEIHQAFATAEGKSGMRVVVHPWS